MATPRDQLPGADASAPDGAQRVVDCSIDFEGEAVPASEGEPVAVALFASGTRVLSRSIKYHRPRTFFCLAGHCGACLMRIEGQPNVKACRAPARSGLTVERQNAFPSGGFDVLAAADFLFPKGMDHHTMFTAPRALNVMMQKVVRQLGGLGKLPETAPAPSELPRGRRRRVDVAIVGAGPAGLAAAIAIRRARPGASVLVVDEEDRPGGSLLVQPGRVHLEGIPGGEGHGPSVARALAGEAERLGVEVRAPARALSWYPEDEGGLLAVEEGGAILRLQAARYLYATGAYDGNAFFPDNDRPGILAARAVGRLVVLHGVRAGERAVVLGDGAYAEALATALAESGARVVRIDGKRERIVGTKGHTWVRSVEIETGAPDALATRRVRCDLVAVAIPPAPASELPRQHGVRVVLDPAAGGFACERTSDGKAGFPGVYVAGDVCGYRGVAASFTDGERIGRALAETL